MDIARWTDPITESNSYYLAEEGACIVIDPNDPTEPIALLRERGWNPEWILLTHEHCDHMLGLEPLRAAYPQARVLVNDVCNAGIQNKRLNMSSMMEVYLTFSGHPGITYPPFVCRPADILYHETCAFFWRGHEFRFVSLPGHTPGSAGIFVDEQHFFSGDYLLPNREVILRLPGGSESDYREITEPFLARLPKGLNIYPGHGDPYVLS